MAAEKQLVNNMTVGSLPKKMLRFALPFMISNVLQVVYSLVDMIVVGKFVGSYGLSAVNVASQLFNVITMMYVGFSNAGQVYIAQVVGADCRDRLNNIIGTLFTMTVLIGAVMTALVLILKRNILVLLDTPPEAFDMAMDYMLVCGIGVLFTYGYNMVSAVLRGMGDSKHPFIFIVTASLINVVLDLLFTGVFGWGVAGAAAATIIGQGASFIFAIVFLYRRKESFGFDFRLKSCKIDKAHLKVLVKLGIPYAIQSAAVNVSMSFVNKLVNGVGVYASAVFGVGVKVDDLVNKASMGIGYAISTTVGQNVAAGNIKRAKHAVYWGWLFAGVCYAVFVTLLLTIGEQMFRIFTDDENVISLAPVFISAIVWSFPCMLGMRGASSFIQGIGNAPLSMTLGILDGVVLRIGLSYLLGVVFDLGLYGFFLGYGVAALGVAVPGMIYFFSGVWKKRKLLAQKLQESD